MSNKGIEKKPKGDWDENYEKLRKVQTNNRWVKGNNETKAGKWIKYIRSQYKKNILDEEHVKKLNDMGFQWEHTAWKQDRLKRGLSIHGPGNQISIDGTNDNVSDTNDTGDTTRNKQDYKKVNKVVENTNDGQNNFDVDKISEKNLHSIDPNKSSKTTKNKIDDDTNNRAVTSIATENTKRKSTETTSKNIREQSNQSTRRMYTPTEVEYMTQSYQIHKKAIMDRMQSMINKLEIELNKQREIIDEFVDWKQHWLKEIETVKLGDERYSNSAIFVTTMKCIVNSIPNEDSIRKKSTDKYPTLSILDKGYASKTMESLKKATENISEDEISFVTQDDNATNIDSARMLLSLQKGKESLPLKSDRNEISLSSSKTKSINSGQSNNRMFDKNDKQIREGVVHKSSIYECSNELATRKKYVSGGLISSDNIIDDAENTFETDNVDQNFCLVEKDKTNTQKQDVGTVKKRKEVHNKGKKVIKRIKTVSSSSTYRNTKTSGLKFDEIITANYHELKRHVFLKYHNLSAIEKVEFDKQIVTNFKIWVDRCYKRGKDLTFIYEKVFNEGVQNTETLRRKYVKMGGYNGYSNVLGGLNDQNGKDRQAQNTVVFKNDDFADVVQFCEEVGKLVALVEKEINYRVFAFHILRQSETGNQGAKEAVFGYHIDQQDDLKNAYLSVIINLKDTNSSMRVAGYKEYCYEGIGSAAVFYSDLWHRTCKAEPGTMKVAFFCEKKVIKEDIQINYVRNTYPDWLCIDGGNIEQFTSVHQNSIQIVKLHPLTSGWFEFAGNEHLSKLESKSSNIRGTKIRMVEWENNKTDLLSVRQELDTSIIDLLGKIKGIGFSTKCDNATTTTRTSTVASNTYETKYHFLKTDGFTPQDPHIDYSWTSIRDCKDKIFKPMIACVPLTEEGSMINVWFPDITGKHVINQDEVDNTRLYFPYKLRVAKGEIAFLNGDVIHGGGLIPSGYRCHIYLCSTSTMGSRVNTYVQENTKNNQLFNICRIPIEDWYHYEAKGVTNQMDNDLLDEECDVGDDTASVDILTQRIENPKINELYDNIVNLDIPDPSSDLDSYQKQCGERSAMCFECIPEYCSKECSNCGISKNVWKNVQVGRSDIDRKGLFASEPIKKDEYIIEYLGLETPDKPENCPDNKYVMQMKHHYIDARYKGSLARYINQHPETNAKFVKKIVNGSERCGVFATRDIPKGKEITCYYG